MKDELYFKLKVVLPTNEQTEILWCPTKSTNFLKYETSDFHRQCQNSMIFTLSIVYCQTGYKVNRKQISPVVITFQ